MSRVFSLRSPTYQEAIITASGDKAAGDPVVSGDVISFAFTDIEDGEKGAVIVKADKVEAAKTAALVVSALDVLYLHTNVVNKTAAGGKIIGYAIEDSAASDTTVMMAFDGTLPTVLDT